MMHRTTPFVFFGAIGVAGLACTFARAGDYELRASGPALDITIDNSSFDGTTAGTPPPILDVDRLSGGSFSAVFRFSTVAPLAGSDAFYDLSPTSGMTFDLFDATGALVHRSTVSTQPQALLENNVGGAPFTADQVLLAVTPGDLSGQHLPVALYTPPGTIVADADLNFSGYVSPGVDFVHDLSIPTDAATYSAFPYKNFEGFIEFSDGDAADRVGPYQYALVNFFYDVTAVSVVAVPEPTMLLCGFAGTTLLIRRRRAL